MRVLLYNELDTKGLKSKIDKVVTFLEKGDFAGAQVKKLKPGAYYRAKLDDTNRLLFRYGRFADEQVILVLETIRSHRYQKSRFLGDNKIFTEEDFNPLEQPKDGLLELKALPHEGREFRLLDKVICFDQAQSELMHLPLPMIVVGSAGSGKTALVLEKMRLISGDILYLSLSSFLVENCSKVYHSHQYVNEQQNVDFLSLKEMIGTIAIPDTMECDFRQFAQWFKRFGAQLKDIDPWQVFEEFRGVITGSGGDKPFVSRDEYLSLGPKQSLFAVQVRQKIFDIFEEYRRFLSKEGLHDPNLLAFNYLSLAESRYDAVIIDEVQDFTVVQILLAMKLLRKRGEFILCGDSNQVVHPNFFSWSKIKTMFYEDNLSGSRNMLKILGRNYRCAPCITDVANKLLRIKQARFGSIDRESHYLIEPLPSSKGSVVHLPAKDKVLKDLNDKTKLSARHAVIVLDDATKEKARQSFQTPLVFSVREAKGLEYENIILFNPVSDHRQAFKEIVSDISLKDLSGEFVFGRNRDKSDRSGEAYKFFINGLYVALSRAMQQVYWIESDGSHPLLSLLGFKVTIEGPKFDEAKSSLEEWEQEAHRLQMQGRLEQAEEIRRTILRHEPVPWPVMDTRIFNDWLRTAINTTSVNKEAQRKLYSLSLYQRSEETRDLLSSSRFGLATEPWEKGRDFVKSRYYKHFFETGWHSLKGFIRRHGVDFRNEFAETPLMVAAREGNLELVKFLLDAGADPMERNFFGLLPVQMLMMEIFAGRRFEDATVSEIYNLLAPEALTYRTDNRLVKLDRRLIEYLLLLAAPPFIALRSQEFREVLYTTYSTASLAAVLGRLPESIFPEKRRKQAYLSAALSRNEVERKAPYNRGLFVRLRLGQYMVYPALSWPKGDEWQGFYHALAMNELMQMTYIDFKRSFCHVMEQVQNYFEKLHLQQLQGKNEEPTSVGDG